MVKVIRFTGPARSGEAGEAGEWSVCNQTLVAVCVLAFISIIIVYAAVDPGALAGRHYLLTAVVLLPLTLGVLYTTRLFPFGAAGPGAAAFWGTVGLFALYLAMRTYETNLAGSPSYMMTTVMNVLAIGVAVAVAATLYSMFGATIQSLQSLPRIGVVFQILMFLPCLFYAFVEFVRKEYGLTTRPTAILLAVDVALIAIYFGVPVLLKYTALRSAGTPLLADVAYLDKRTPLLTETSGLQYDPATAFAELGSTPPAATAAKLKNNAEYYTILETLTAEKAVNAALLNEAASLKQRWMDAYVTQETKTLGGFFGSGTYTVNVVQQRAGSTPIYEDDFDAWIEQNIVAKCDADTQYYVLDSVQCPLYAHNQKVLASNTKLAEIAVSLNTNLTKTSTTSFRTAYAISMWLFVNPAESQGGGEVTVFRYGAADGDGHPALTYRAADRLFVARIAGADAAPLTLSSDDILPQSWNYVVFNYTGAGVEIFVNGDIKKTATFTDVRPAYLATDAVVAGQAGGLYGAIYEVMYHTQPMARSEVAAFYAYRRLYALPKIPVRG
jgi:hypothetical protein